MCSCTATGYDVFLSFRGIDTRCNFTSFLDNALVDRKIQTFKDDKELEENGQCIPSNLICAIENSKIAVVVVSTTFAASVWCLEELVTIMDLQKKGKITVMPIFYGVEPCQVRKQIEAVAEHFEKYEDRVKEAENVFSWRRALNDLANLSGYCSSEWKDEAEQVGRIVDEISENLMIVKQLKEQKSSGNATRYQVFLSFRGPDTRHNFISFLYNVLIQRKIQTFKDEEELENGQHISSELIRAIEDSEIAVVVVSATYAASSWCLNELVKIMDLQRKNLITVIPIFYGVYPCHVRRQTKGFAEQFKKHEDREDSEKVSSWRSALTDLADLSGYCSFNWNDDAKLVDKIAEKIAKNPKIVTTSSNKRQLNGNGKHMEEIKRLLDLKPNENSRALGIWAVGCKSRWALATNVYHNYCEQFDSHCFLEDVEKIPQVHLLNDLRAEFTIERETLSNPKVLLVANNVNDHKHFDALAEGLDRFGPGSVLVITTQDKRLFESYGIKHVYEPECLRFQEVSAPLRSTCIKKGFLEDELIYPAAVFNVNFNGNSLFEDYVGQFAYASMASFETGLESYEPEIKKQMLEEKIKVMEKDREDKLVAILKIKLEPFVRGQTDEFINWATAEAKRLSTADLGEAMLQSVGYIYTRKAAKELGKDKRYMKVPYLAEWAREKGHQVKSLGKAVSGGISLYGMQDVIENIEKANEATMDAMCQSVRKLDAFFMESTLSHVCRAVLKDPTVPKDVLRARARGLKKLGTIFQGEVI